MHNIEFYKNIFPTEDDLTRIWNIEINKLFSENSNGCSSFSKQGMITTGYVLGGQPGSGKSFITNKIINQDHNVVCINGDLYRRWHPFYSEIQEKFGKDSSKITAPFAGKVTEALIKRAIEEKYNVLIEGTFRTAETPLKTLQNLKDNGYRTVVLIKTCPAEVSWNRCLSRYEEGLKEQQGNQRYTAKEHHDLVVSNLAKNADTVFKSGLVDMFMVVGDSGKVIFDSTKNNLNLNPSHSISKELGLDKDFSR